MRRDEAAKWPNPLWSGEPSWRLLAAFGIREILDEQKAMRVFTVLKFCQVREVNGMLFPASCPMEH